MRKITSTNYQNETNLVGQCPLVYSLSKIGSRWKPYIIWKLLDKTLRYCELKREIPLIAERMLILSLKELEKDGLIMRTEYKQVPPKVEYSLTDSGNELRNILEGLYQWGEKELKRKCPLYKKQRDKKSEIIQVS
jgi:DNA-binding HxlR family transcriptional regulator